MCLARRRCSINQPIDSTRCISTQELLKPISAAAASANGNMFRPHAAASNSSKLQKQLQNQDKRGSVHMRRSRYACTLDQRPGSSSTHHNSLRMQPNFHTLHMPLPLRVHLTQLPYLRFYKTKLVAASSSAPSTLPYAECT